ncbi:MAG TPA: DUF89 family protein [Chloroflexi bacterium]|nr:DUF89 family protein [Chloroflexota bacterium]
MKTYLDCFPCFLRQALEAARMAGADEERQRLILDRTMALLQDASLESKPPEIGDRVHRIVRQLTGDDDPYAAVKAESTREALRLYPRLKALVAEDGDRLERAIRIAIAGNVIDFATGADFDIKEGLERILNQPFAINDIAAFRKALSEARSVLYLGDNAGETVFDRVLIEALDVPVIYAVKGGPIINDATVDDALAAGLDEVAEVVSTGSDAPGTILSRCSAEFRALYERAELVIAKGQANYETLSGEGGRLFFLLKVKCPVIARDIGAPVGSIVLKQG